MSIKLNHALLTSALLLGVLPASGCKQPDVPCSIYYGDFAARYERMSGDPMTCGGQVGDIIGAETYYPLKDGRPDLFKGTAAIRPEYVNDLVYHAAEQGVVDLTMDENTLSLGDFTDGYPDAEDFCEVPSLSSATLSIPEVPEVLDDPETPDDDESYPLQPATTITYEWSNLKVYVTPDAQGTQFSADLHFEQDGCAAEYHVIAMSPVVACATNEECDDDANGINTGFSTECLTDLGICVLTDEPPSYK